MFPVFGTGLHNFEGTHLRSDAFSDAEVTPAMYPSQTQEQP